MKLLAVPRRPPSGRGVTCLRDWLSFPRPPSSRLPLPTQAHDIYSHLTDEAGASCCDDRDCRLALYRFLASGLQMFIDGQWIDVPGERIQYRALLGDTGETGGGHWCGAVREFEFIGNLYMTKCAVLPPQSASAQDEP
jgi:hypothetical protein